MIQLRWYERWASYHRKRWAGTGRLARFGLCLTLVSAVAALTLTSLWAHEEYTGPWETYAAYLTYVMVAGLVTQCTGQWLDGRRTEKT
jgi:hypothetical protein